MARETRSDARVASEGPSPTVTHAVFFRSAGACPPRALECADDGEGNPLACACGIRGPKPYGNARRFFRSAGACPPRALEYADDGEGNPLACACGMRGPSPYDEGGLSAPAAPGGLSYTDL